MRARRPRQDSARGRRRAYAALARLHRHRMGQPGLGRQRSEAALVGGGRRDQDLPSVPECEPDASSLGRGPPAAVPDVLAELVGALQELPEPIRLVLDDVHVLVEPDTLHGFETFIRNQPPTVRLVLCSRFDPPLALHRLRLAGRLRELRADRIRLSLDETATLLAKAGRAALRSSWCRPCTSAPRAGRPASGSPRSRWAPRPTATPRSPSTRGTTARSPTTSSTRCCRACPRTPSTSCAPPASSTRSRRYSQPSSPAGRTPAASSTRSSTRPGWSRRSVGAGTATGCSRCCAPTCWPTCTATPVRTGSSSCTPCAARWWTAEGDPVTALRHAMDSADAAVVQRSAAPRRGVAAAHRGPRAAAARAARLGPAAVAADPLLSLISALTSLTAGERAEAQGFLRHALHDWPADPSGELSVLRAAAEQLGAIGSDRCVPGRARSRTATSRIVTGPSRPARRAWPGGTGPAGPRRGVDARRPRPCRRPVGSSSSRCRWPVGTTSTSSRCSAWSCSACSPASTATCGGCTPSARRRSARSASTAGRSRRGRSEPRRCSPSSRWSGPSPPTRRGARRRRSPTTTARLDPVLRFALRVVHGGGGRRPRRAGARAGRAAAGAHRVR